MYIFYFFDKILRIFKCKVINSEWLYNRDKKICKVIIESTYGAKNRADRDIKFMNFGQTIEYT